jgi:X-Pro dipeptidyl-peptidase
LAKAPTSKNRLLYVSPILKEDLHISGLASLEIRVSSSKPAANLSVWLVSLPWNEAEDALIYDNIITRGWADPQNHESISRSEPLVPGEFYTLKFDLQPDDQIIPAGQQIGLMIFSSDQEFTLHPQPGTVLKVDLRGTTLTLPVVGGEEAYQAATN